MMHPNLLDGKDKWSKKMKLRESNTSKSKK